VVGVVVVRAAREGEVGDAHERERHLGRRAARVPEFDDPAAALAGIDHALVVRRNVVDVEEFEVVRAHRAERGPLARDPVGHLPPVEHAVVVGEGEPTAAGRLPGRRFLDPEVLDARHGSPSCSRELSGFH